MEINRLYGPFGVKGNEVNTNIEVRPGDHLKIVSRGEVKFSYLGWPKASADGEYHTTQHKYIEAPDEVGFPAPGLVKHSLVCRISGTTKWYQGGCVKTFSVSDSGQIILATNDNTTFDNSGKWKVVLFRIQNSDHIVVLTSVHLGNDTITKIVEATGRKEPDVRKILNELKKYKFISEKNDEPDRFMITQVGIKNIENEMKTYGPKTEEMSKILEKDDENELKSFLMKNIPWMNVISVMLRPEALRQFRLVGMRILRRHVGETIRNSTPRDKIGDSATSNLPTQTQTSPQTLPTQIPQLQPTNIPQNSVQPTPYSAYDTGIYDRLGINPNSVLADRNFANTILVTPPPIIPPPVQLPPGAVVPPQVDINDPLGYLPPPEVAAPLVYHNPFFQDYWTQAQKPTVYFKGDEDQMIYQEPIEQVMDQPIENVDDFPGESEGGDGGNGDDGGGGYDSGGYY